MDPDCGSSLNNYGPIADDRRLLSVVIPAYNEEKNVAAIFEGVRLSLPGPEVCEIIFVDDGSVDATAERVRSLLRETLV